jgi:hypothetical protein
LLLDRGPHNKHSPTKWASGEELKLGFFLDVKNPTRAITAYRCLDCGRLELYARKAI